MPRKPKIKIFGGNQSGSIYYNIFVTKSRKTTPKNMKFKSIKISDSIRRK
tara:strand:+ start:581 stop:730 length:150 start_codon:yes stop_codon:yes gene_type:complete